MLRDKLEALDGVERATVDEATNTIWIHCSPDAPPTELRNRVVETIKANGTDPDAITLELLTDLASRRRVRFAGVDRRTDPDHRVRIRVSLEWNGEVKYGEAVGEEGDLIELRTSAAASLQALEQVLGEELDIKLAGVKQVKAFDAELMVVALYTSKGTPTRLVGSVSVGDNPRRAAAVAVLNALNRLLGNYLSVRE